MAREPSSNSVSQPEQRPAQSPSSIDFSYHTHILPRPHAARRGRSPQALKSDSSSRDSSHGAQSSQQICRGQVCYSCSPREPQQPEVQCLEHHPPSPGTPTSMGQAGCGARGRAQEHPQGGLWFKESAGCACRAIELADRQRCVVCAINTRTLGGATASKHPRCKHVQKIAGEFTAWLVICIAHQDYWQQQWWQKYLQLPDVPIPCPVLADALHYPAYATAQCRSEAPLHLPLLLFLLLPLPAPPPPHQCVYSLCLQTPALFSAGFHWFHRHPDPGYYRGVLIVTHCCCCCCCCCYSPFQCWVPLVPSAPRHWTLSRSFLTSSSWWHWQQEATWSCSQNRWGCACCLGGGCGGDGRGPCLVGFSCVGGGGGGGGMVAGLQTGRTRSRQQRGAARRTGGACTLCVLIFVLRNLGGGVRCWRLWVCGTGVGRGVG